MTKYIFTLLFLFVFNFLHAQKKNNFDVQAHAGGKGLYPGNSIPAFINALKLGVNTLEMDCVISQDRMVVVSHDPYMNHAFILTPSGKEIEQEKQKDYNIFRMPYDSIRKYQLGVKFDPEFPLQKRIRTYKPLLHEVIDSVERYVQQYHLKRVKYNIEIKSYQDSSFNPAPAAFAERVAAVIKEHQIENRVLIQSFDVRPLQYIRKHYPEFKLSYLISKNNKNTLQQNLDKLGFTPAVISPEFDMVTTDLINESRQFKMSVIPWTIDKAEDLRRFISLKVDGIITNYPDLLIKVLSEK